MSCHTSSAPNSGITISLNVRQTTIKTSSGVPVAFLELTGDLSHEVGLPLKRQKLFFKVRSILIQNCNGLVRGRFISFQLVPVQVSI
jgi:hypothetical protein